MLQILVKKVKDGTNTSEKWRHEWKDVTIREVKQDDKWWIIWRGRRGKCNEMYGEWEREKKKKRERKGENENVQWMISNETER